jgi:LysR family transcriptional regulator, hydrogen peroxide-inducible genes activator
MAIDLTALTLTELRYAVALAEHRHFGRAARACSVSQPTLSAQIQKLERTLGVKVFERTSHRVEPTPIGEAVVEQARRVLEETEKILGVVQSQAEPLSGPLRLGVIPTLGPYLLPWLVPPLQKAHKGLRLVLRELRTAELLAELADHRLDAGILALPVAGRGLVTAELFDEPFLALVPKGHALAERKRVAPEDLVDETLLLLEEGHCLRDQALEVCGQGRAAARDGGAGDFRATSIETLRHMVAAGLGVTLIPALALGRGAQRGGAVAVPFSAARAGRRVALVWRRTHPRAADLALLADFVRAHVPAGVRALR